MSRRVSCIPSNDVVFREAAAAALAGLDHEIELDDIAVVLTNRLRVDYPLVEVHRQHPMARIADEDVWYAYRDCRPIPA
jgi:hypothetical protein